MSLQPNLPITPQLKEVKRLIEKYASFIQRKHGFYEQIHLEEAKQNTLIIAWEKYHYFNPKKGKFENWLFTIFNRELIRFYRNNKRYQGFEEWDMVETIEFEGFEFEYANQDKHELVQKAINKLGPKQKQVVELRMEGLFHYEIAEIMGITEGTSKSQYIRAIQNLKKYLEIDSN